jgi:hypothetical protein
VGGDGQVGGRGRGPGQPAGQHAQRVGGMQAGEDGPPVAALQLDPLDAHGHVDHAVGRGHHGQGRGQPAEPGGEGDRRQRGRVDGEGQPQAAPAAQASHQRPAHRQSDQGPALQAEDGHGEGARRQAQALLDGRDARGPGRDHEAGREEHGGGGDAGPAVLGSWHASPIPATSISIHLDIASLF